MKGIRSVAETKSKVPSTKYVQGAIESENVHAESTKKSHESSRGCIQNEYPKATMIEKTTGRPR